MRFDGDIPIWGVHDDATIAQIKKCRETADYAVLCADGHLGYSVPIGGVVAYEDSISPSAVGFDQACGNKAVRLDIPASKIKCRIDGIMDEIVNTISFGVGRTNNEKIDHPLFDTDWNHPAIRDLKGIARDQLGTVGSGNHYVDVFEGDDGFVWIGVHFGSRGLGHKATTWFLKAAGAKDGMNVPPLVLKADSDLGAGFIECFKITSQYAYAGRDWVCDKVAKIIGGNQVDSVHNNHNGLWRENHFGKEKYVIRKGSTPAFPGQRCFVGGSMGDNAVILEGIDSEYSRKSLFSTIHGSGRVMSRTVAKGKFVRGQDGKKYRTEGLVRHDEWQKWIRDFGVVVRGGDVDESPQAYRRLSDVLDCHKDTVRVLRILKPIGVAMAGRNIIDPYKD